MPSWTRPSARAPTKLVGVQNTALTLLLFALVHWAAQAGRPLVMGLAAVFIRSGLHAALTQAGLPLKMAQVASVLSAIALGGALYMALARLLRFPEWHDVIQAIRERRQRKSRPQ